MWVMTELGFFSAVQDPDDADILQVRCRSRKDALALGQWLVETDNLYLDEYFPTVESLVLEWKGRDYPYRVLLWREQWIAFMSASAGAIDYTNFKNNVKKEQGQRRAQIYGRIWGVLLDVENEDRPEPPIAGAQWLDQLHDLSSEESPLLRSHNDSDERCPRCDKFLNDVGVNFEGECSVCIAELDVAMENHDWDEVTRISVEMGFGEMTS